MMSLSAARRRISVMKQWSYERAFGSRDRRRRARRSCARARSPRAIRRVRRGRRCAVVCSQAAMAPIVFDLFETAEHRLVRQVVELLATEIVVTSLHVADVQLASAVRKQSALQERNVFVEELFLQVLGAGRNDDALARANDRQQIGKRFAGAGAGLDDQVALLFDGRFDGLCHLQLSAAEFVRGMRFRQHSAGRKELVERGFCGRRCGMGAQGHRVSIITSGAVV